MGEESSDKISALSSNARQSTIKKGMSEILQIMAASAARRILLYYPTDK